MSIQPTTDSKYTTLVNRGLPQLKKDWKDACRRYDKVLADKKELHKYIYFLYTEEHYTKQFIADLLGVTKQRIHTIINDILKNRGGVTK